LLTSVGGFYFRTGNYSQHAEFRQLLAHAALNVDADDIYADPGRFRDQPFFELFFADTEGCIGPLAPADLAADFAQGRESRVRARLNEAYQSLYDVRSHAYTLASGSGLVYFQ
jgi:hypothetical protein